MEINVVVINGAKGGGRQVSGHLCCFSLPMILRHLSELFTPIPGHLFILEYLVIKGSR